MDRNQRAVRAGTANERPVLVVEDDPDIGMMLETIFENEGFRVLRAWQGLDALRIAAAESPGLLTLDLDLPDVSGQEVLHRLGQDPCLAHVPVVVLSAYSRRLRPTPQVVRVMDKPFDIDELLSTTELALAADDQAA